MNLLPAWHETYQAFSPTYVKARYFLQLHKQINSTSSKTPAATTLNILKQKFKNNEFYLHCSSNERVT